MRVDLETLVNGEWTFDGTFEVAELRETNAEDPETIQALDRLEAGFGSVEVGGGAAPLVRLSRLPW